MTTASGTSKPSCSGASVSKPSPSPAQPLHPRSSANSNVPIPILAALALQVAFALITLSLVVLLPESPRWLAAHGQIPAARDVLHRLDSSPSEKARAVSVDVQMNEILSAIELERTAGTGGSFKTCFTMGDQRFFHRVFLGMGSQFMQQICGINLITSVNHL